MRTFRGRQPARAYTRDQSGAVVAAMVLTVQQWCASADGAWCLQHKERELSGLARAGRVHRIAKGADGRVEHQQQVHARDARGVEVDLHDGRFNVHPWRGFPQRGVGAQACCRSIVGKSRHIAHTESQREESGESQFLGSLWRATLSRGGGAFLGSCDLSLCVLGHALLSWLTSILSRRWMEDGWRGARV